MPDQPAPQEPEPIPAGEARAILDAAVRERLGDDWDKRADGWTEISGHAYMARMTNGRANVDFYVDLLGKVTIEEKPISPGQETGRLLAWLILSGSLVTAFLIARIAGYL